MTTPLLPTITPDTFFSVDMRVGKITEVKDFPEARKPAYQVWADFGPAIGIRKTSAQITVHYSKEELVGCLIVGWVNAPQKQVGPFMSEFLILGSHDAAGAVILLEPTINAIPGSRIS